MAEGFDIDHLAKLARLSLTAEEKALYSSQLSQILGHFQALADADLPATIDEGRFAFFAREELGNVAVPETDRTLLWPVYDEHRRGFIAYRAECHPGAPLRVVIEETSAKPNLD